MEAKLLQNIQAVFNNFLDQQVTYIKDNVLNVSYEEASVTYKVNDMMVELEVLTTNGQHKAEFFIGCDWDVLIEELPYQMMARQADYYVNN